MPLYEYECDACGQRFELIQKFSDASPAACDKCGKGPVRRLLSSPAIQFKGSGWYITDYAQKGKSDSASGSTGKPDSAEKATQADTAATSDGKSDGKTEKKSDASSTPASPSTAKT